MWWYPILQWLASRIGPRRFPRQGLSAPSAPGRTALELRVAVWDARARARRYKRRGQYNLVWLAQRHAERLDALREGRPDPT